MEQLRNQVSRLEEENAKLSKSEETRRKLELEVNYWKEYVTNAQQLKRVGGTIDNAKDLADTRQKLIQAQDEVNEAQKRSKLNSGEIAFRLLFCLCFRDEMRNRSKFEIRDKCWLLLQMPLISLLL